MKKQGFFKTYYKNLKELNVSLLMFVALFVVAASSITSYALFGTEVVSDDTISLKVGLPKTDDACFTVDNLGTITEYKCFEDNPYGLYAVYDVVIPNTINGITVNEIDDFVFESKNLNSVIIPNTIKVIGSYAFNYNNFKEITIPSSVMTLADGAFNNNSLENVTILGKSATTDFTKFGKDVFGFAEGFSSDNVIFK